MCGSPLLRRDEAADGSIECLGLRGDFGSTWERGREDDFLGRGEALEGEDGSDRDRCRSPPSSRPRLGAYFLGEDEGEDDWADGCFLPTPKSRIWDDTVTGRSVGGNGLFY